MSTSGVLFEGIDFDRVDVLPTTPYTNATSGLALVAPFYQGQTEMDRITGTTYMYVKYNTTVTKNFIFPIDKLGVVQAGITSATTPTRLGVVVTANASSIAVGNFGWVAVQGPITGITFDANAYTAGNKVGISATAGKVSATQGANTIIPGLVGIAAANATTVACTAFLPLTVSCMVSTNS